MVQSVLSGFVIIALATMAKSALNRLWQRTLMSTASDALAGAESMGFVVQPLGFGPRIRAHGVVAGQKASVEWCGGLRGETCWLRIGKRKRQVPLFRTVNDWQRILGTEE